MADLLRHPSSAPARDGRILEITSETAGWRHVGFEVLWLISGQGARRESADREMCVVVIGGRCAVRAGDGPWQDLGERPSPFDGPPAAFYAPPGCAVEIRALSDAEIAIGSAPAAGGLPARALPPSGARLEVRGSGAMERRIHHILMEDQPASSLLVTEVVTPAGHWSSYPPHKHDTDDPPRERYLEETYFCHVRDPRGFALMRVYTKGPRASGPSSPSEQVGSLDESIAVRDGDLVLVPRGYHTFSAAPGYEAYYLNVMAGPTREWKITFDPDHERMRW